MLISVHPMAQHFFAYLLRHWRLADDIPLVTVVTDPCKGFWRGWASPDVSRYFVAHEEAKTQLIAYGIADERITVSGMPVHARFHPIASDEEKRQLRQQLQLNPDAFILLVNAGWIGGGNIPRLFRALLEIPLPGVHVVFIAGRHEALRREAETWAKTTSCSVTVLGFIPDMAPWMQAADMMLSKLGGLTTFEAMACHLPILADGLTPPMPQEAGTARLMVESGAGVLVTSVDVMRDKLTMLLTHSAEYDRMRKAAAQLGKPGAVDGIARAILAMAP
jgi:UDP-N-acetylglucosamine:LPS N-acetylglucosamine transferase